MCGIAGQFTHAAERPSAQTLVAMGAAMEYRGPDDTGTFIADHVGLVHKRLSIRDVSPAGRCPMATPDGSIQVLLNGEIYNWRELRAELERGGVAFRSHSDTEVIVHGYERWGDALVPRLRGMFAIAVWDERSKRLLLARDRAGEKPLFYRADAAGLAFASSLEALRAVGTCELDSPALANYLAHCFIPSSRTIWQDVQVLPQAHSLAIKVGEQPVIKQYWEFPRRGPRRVARGECEREAEATIEDSVVRCLDADVEVGVFLSGGVDSSLVAAMAAKHHPAIRAFSVGFAEAEVNEVPYARAVARHTGLQHHVIEAGVGDLLACLPHLVTQYGQPFGDASAVPTHLCSMLARRHVKVCLSGDGADESFGGYWRLQSGVYASRYAALLPLDLRKRVVPRIAPKLGALGRRWEALNTLSLAQAGSGYTNSTSWFPYLDRIAGPRLQLVSQAELCASRAGHALDRREASTVQRVLFDDFQVQLPDDYLTKVDVASMAASLEVRAPYLDQKVIELAWTLPDSMKLHWGQRKWLLKRIAARWVPSEVIYRPKMGFALPLPKWFRSALGGALESLLKDSVAGDEGWIRPQVALDMLAEHRRGQDHSTRLWLVLWLELWFRLVVRNSSTVDATKAMRSS